MGLFEPEYLDRIYIFTDEAKHVHIQHEHARGRRRTPQEIIEILLHCAQSMASANGLVIGPVERSLERG